MSFFMDEPEVLETLAPVDEVESETELVEVEESQTDEEKEALRRENEELKKKNSQLYERAKKKEAVLEHGKLSPKDYLALNEAKVSAQDFDEVQEFANYKKISITEALAHPTLKTILNDRVEERKTAQTTEIRSARAGQQRQSGEDILRKAERTNAMPDSEDDMNALFLARRARQFGIDKS